MSLTNYRTIHSVSTFPIRIIKVFVYYVRITVTGIRTINSRIKILGSDAFHSLLCRCCSLSLPLRDCGRARSNNPELTHLWHKRRQRNGLSNWAVAEGVAVDVGIRLPLTMGPVPGIIIMPQPASWALHWGALPQRRGRLDACWGTGQMYAQFYRTPNKTDP